MKVSQRVVREVEDYARRHIAACGPSTAVAMSAFLSVDANTMQEILSKSESFEAYGSSMRYAGPNSHHEWQQWAYVQLFSTAEMAEHLGVTTRTITRWVSEGVLQPPVKTCGGKQYWNQKQRSEITAWLLAKKRNK